MSKQYSTQGVFSNGIWKPQAEAGNKTWPGVDKKEIPKKEKTPEKKPFKREKFMWNHTKRLDTDPEYARQFLEQGNSKDYSGEFGEQKREADKKKVDDFIEKSGDRLEKKKNKTEEKIEAIVSKINSGTLSSSQIDHYTKKLNALRGKSVEIDGYLSKYPVSDNISVASTEDTDTKKGSEKDISNTPKKTTTVSENTTKTDTSSVSNKTTPSSSTKKDTTKTGGNGSIETIEDLHKLVSRKYEGAYIEGNKVYATKNGKTHSWTFSGGYADDLGPTSASNGSKAGTIDNLKGEERDDENVGMREYNKSVEKYKANAEDFAEKNTDIETEAGKMKSDLVKEKNKDARDRAEDREDELEDLVAEYTEASEERREEIAKILKSQKDQAGRAANIAAALTGAQGYNMSESERDSMRDDVMSKYAGAITEAEIAALTQNRNIDNDLRDLGFSKLAQQSDIDALKDRLDTEEYAPLLEAIDQAKAGNKKAVEDVYNFIAAGIKKQSDEELNRGLATKRIEDKEEEFTSADVNKKISLLNDMLYNVDGYDNLGSQIQELVEANPDKSMAQIVNELKEMSASVNQKNILSNSIVQKEYSTLSENEKEVIDDVLSKKITIEEAKEKLSSKDTKKEKKDDTANPDKSGGASKVINKAQEEKLDEYLEDKGYSEKEIKDYKKKNNISVSKKLPDEKSDFVPNGKIKSVNDLYSNVRSKYKDAYIQGDRVYATKNGKLHSWSYSKGYAQDLGVQESKKTSSSKASSSKSTSKSDLKERVEKAMKAVNGKTITVKQAQQLIDAMKKAGYSNGYITTYFKSGKVKIKK